MSRDVKNIELGIHEGQIAWIMEFSDGQKESFLFDHRIAKKFADNILKIHKELTYIDRQMVPPGDKVEVSDSATVKLTQPEDDDGEKKKE